MNHKRLTPFLDSSTTHSTVSRLMVVTVCRVDNHPSRFLSPAYSILHSYVHKFKNHTCQRSYHFFIYIIRNHNVHLHKSYATTFPNVVHVLLFLTIVIILLPKVYVPHMPLPASIHSTNHLLYPSLPFVSMHSKKRITNETVYF